MSAARPLMEIGLLVGTHGLRGDLKLHPLPTGESALRADLDLLLQDRDGELTPIHLERCTPHKQSWLLRFRGIDDLDAARSLVGQTLLIPRDQLPEREDGGYFWCDLEGLAVVDQRRGSIGHVEEMFATAAHDILVVRGSLGEILIPAIPPFVREIAIENAQLLVDLPDGLVPEADEV